MDTNPTFVLGGDGSGRCFCLRRACDGSYLGYLRQTEEGHWKLRDMEEKDYENIPAFRLRDEAALFLYMRGRVFQTTLEVHTNERIQVRVSPNFGQWYAHECVPGLWAASLHQEDGRCAGATRCALSVAEAKVAGIQQAYCGALAQEDARSKSEQLHWQESTDVSS